MPIILTVSPVCFPGKLIVSKAGYAHLDLNHMPHTFHMVLTILTQYPLRVVQAGKGVAIPLVNWVSHAPIRVVLHALNI